jgi:cyclin B
MKFGLTPETLYLCISIIDRYMHLETEMVKRSEYQLVGITALLIASKYEEIYPPEVKEMVYIADRTFTHQDVLDMELHILRVLDYELAVPTGYPFLVRYLEILKYSDSIVQDLASYYMERMLQEYSMLNYRPSLIAAAAVSLARSNPDVLEETKEENEIHVPGVVRIKTFH